MDENHLRLVLGGELDPEIDGFGRRRGAIGSDQDLLHRGLLGI